MKTFTARYPGRCHAECGESIEPGDDCVYVEDHPVHAWCADIASDALRREEKTAEVCTTCWLTKPCDCEVA